jgi:hypothetical protein
MARDVEVTMDVVVEMMVAVVDIGMIMVVIITLVLLEKIAMTLAKELKRLVDGSVNAVNLETIVNLNCHAT